LSINRIQFFDITLSSLAVFRISKSADQLMNVYVGAASGNPKSNKSHGKVRKNEQ